MKPYYETYPELFILAHQNHIHKDGKAIADAIPRGNIDIIFLDYQNQSLAEGFDYKIFFYQNFDIPASSTTDFESRVEEPLENHIKRLWPYLKRDKDKTNEGSSLIPLPHAYIVPGGRFNEVYYWDSYFTMLGLQIDNHIDLIETIVENFAHQINELGYIPNGNRAYYIGRSQPPFFSHMVCLLAEAIKDDNIIKRYLLAMEKEFNFFTSDERKVLIDNNIELYHYCDFNKTPRIEMYQDDLELAKDVQDKEGFYNNIRAACESGWDFSSRWLTDPHKLSTIITTSIIPIDLNCLLYHIAFTISKYSDDSSQKYKFELLSNQLKDAINNNLWCSDWNCYRDYNIQNKSFTDVVSVAAIYPIFVGIATDNQAKFTVEKVMKELLFDGGLSCTNVSAQNQWDSPNGWAPLQWIAIKGMLNYGFISEAKEIAKRWCKLNEDVFRRTGKMMEKYNVVDLSLDAGGGEYEVQDGFGWTNGVYLKLRELLSK